MATLFLFALVLAALYAVFTIHAKTFPPDPPKEPLPLCSILSYDCLPYTEAVEKYPDAKKDETENVYFVEVVMADDDDNNMRVVYQISASDYIEKLDNILYDIPAHWVMLNSEYI